MKKLYILLLVLILFYITVNLAYTVFNPGDGFANIFSNNELDDENAIIIGSSSFENLGNFTNTKINDNAVSLVDSVQNLTINVSELDDSEDLTQTVNNLLINNANITSNQTLDQNGVTVYFLYEEGSEAYNADIYFNKNGHNYLISGDNISYDGSDYFINNCKDIINLMNLKEESGFMRW